MNSTDERDTRPPGGTLRPNNGTKTPRKVQWVDVPHVLDESGLDPAPFETLTDALQRHQSGDANASTPSGTRIHYFPPQRPASVTAPLLEPNRVSHKQNFSTATTNTTFSSDDEHSITGTVTPIHNVPGNFIDPNERSGLPGRDLDAYARRHKSKGFSWGIKTQEPLSGGRVFSNLIATTGNLSGAAAPVSAQLQPNIKRPGYTLSHYSLESNLPTMSTVNGSKLLRPAIKRHRSMHSDPSGSQVQLPGSPGGSEASTPESPTPPQMTHSRTRWSGMLKDFPSAGSVFNLTKINGWSTPGGGSATPTTDGGDEWVEEKRHEKKRRRKKEVYITRHVAQIIQRQEFILKLTRAMMMFGAPSHRLAAQIQATARVIDIQLNCMYLPDVMLISFDDGATSTSSIRLVKQGSSLDLQKLRAAYKLYWKASGSMQITELRLISVLQVIHDNISVSDASAELDQLMIAKSFYNYWQLVLIGGLCSSAICTVSFYGSFIDAVTVYPLGCILVAIQLISVRHELYSNIFEITVATLFSFISAALSATHVICFAAVASSAVVLILPGYIVLIGALELMSRNIVSGSVRLCYAIVYVLFLSFGLSMGAEAYQKITGHTIGTTSNYTCSDTHNADGGWWQRDVSPYWAFLSVPLYSLSLSMRLMAPYNVKDTIILVLISCIGWVTNHFTSKVFVNQSDISAAVGAFAVGLVSNLYARFFHGNAFVIMITGIMFQLPSGLGNGGMLFFTEEQISGSSSSYISGFQTALQLISVSIGLTVGLGISLFLAHPIRSRRRAGGIFSL
ncbi:hypothetical protein FISHEDRAFT_40445 [Fistulina hepatica ATCC 64428]|uniref:DUF1212-domain-containing protein n=1 Tax=Fistulina hepatica ATCC 64428 TaxID=1128425 RepID=A0A0D7AE99_9AGAR|nr:hypothetical protein FISHEDRAFT_40445 [Fistulina hepatica ATCC 64428]